MKNIILTTVFILLSSNVFANSDSNNPYKSFYVKQVYKTCGQSLPTLSWHLCSQKESVKQIKNFARNNNLKSKDYDNYIDDLEKIYYDIILYIDGLYNMFFELSNLAKKRLDELSFGARKEISEFSLQ